MLSIENVLKRFGNAGTQKVVGLLFPSQLSLPSPTPSRILVWMFVIQDGGCARK